MTACARGCVRRGEHFASCLSFGVTGGPCRGCVPREAFGSSLVCGRCFARTRGMLEAVPDMLGHLRGLTNPLRGTDYAAKADRAGQRGNPAGRAPVPADLLDAADYLLTLLWSTAEVVEGRMPQGRVQVPVDAGVPGLVGYARELLTVILDRLTTLSEQPEIVPLVDAVVGRPASSEEWTVRTILERWSTTEEPWWAAQPCPLCGARSVKVTPPAAPGDEITYECKLCDWLAPEDVDGFWAEAFSRRDRQAA